VDGRLLPEALRGRTSFVLIRLAALLRQDCAERLAGLGLSQHQHAILCALAEFGPAAQKDVAARLGLDSGDLVAFLDGLQRAALISRDRDDRDRRRQILTITASGHEVLARAEAALDEGAQETLGALDQRERAELRRLGLRVLVERTPEHWTAGAPTPV
jgi:DNA-binding MarR family transcriptional regulator